MDDLKIPSLDKLQGLERFICETCGRSKMYFCADCFLPNPALVPSLPHVSLPIPLHVIQYKENMKKSSASHAMLVAPDDTSWHNYPEIPPLSKSALLYPSDDALPMEEVDWTQVEHLIVIESTWIKAKCVAKDERLANVQKVKLNKYHTKFWRYQQVGPEGLATIEAIYYLYVECFQAQHGDYDGRYDPLLYFFVHMYQSIQQHYQAKQKPFKRIKNYVHLKEQSQ